MDLHEVPTVELLEVHLVNAVAPFVLNARLKPLMLAVETPDKHVVNVVDALGEAPEQMIPDGDIWRLGLTPEEIIARIPADTQAIGITSMWSYSWPIVRELIGKVKAAFPKVPIVCGGEHFTAVPDLSMEQSPADFLVLGEGEETAVALFRALELGLDHTVIPGIAFRTADGKVQT